MANVVEIVVTGKDLSGAALEQANKNVRKLGQGMVLTTQEAGKMRGSLIAVGVAMRAGVVVAEQYGQTMTANVGKTLLEGTTSMAVVVGLLGKTKLGMVAVGAQAVQMGLELAEALKPIAPDWLLKLMPNAKDVAIANTLFDQLATKIQETVNAEAAAFQSLAREHEARVKIIGTLNIEQEKANQLSAMSHELMEKQKTALSKEQGDARQAIFEAQKNKEAALMRERVAAASQAFGDLAEAAKAFGKKGFEAYKAFAIAQAIIDTYAGANAAFKSLSGIPFVGPALGVAAAAAAIAAGLARVATIAATKPTGIAHGGLDYVPTDATYLLQRGEAVIQANQNEALGEFLNRNAGPGTGNTTVVVNLDGRELFRSIGQASRDGRLVLSAKGVRA